MSHKKSNSKVHVPFAWERIPGVPKFMASPICAFIPGLGGGYNREVQAKLSLPLPPGSFRKPVRRVSKGIFLWKEDPFLVAMIECTKDCDNLKCKGEMKKTKSKSLLLSCKHSFEIEESHLSRKPSRLGSILHCNRV